MINKHKTIQLYLIGFIFVAVITAIGFIIYSGFYSGVFTMPFEQDPVLSYDIRLAESKDFENASSELSGESHVDSSGVTYNQIKLDEIKETEGIYSDPDHAYLAYSFFITNLGTTDITIDYYLRVVEVMNNMDEFVRILIIEDNEIYRLYKKEDNIDDQGNLPSYDDLQESMNFLSHQLIFRDDFSNFKPNEVKSFRVILWLESKDPDLTETFDEGKFKSSMVFSIRDPYQELSMKNKIGESLDQDLWIPTIFLCSVQLEIISISS